MMVNRTPIGFLSVVGFLSVDQIRKLYTFTVLLSKSCLVASENSLLFKYDYVVMVTERWISPTFHHSELALPPNTLVSCFI